MKYHNKSTKIAKVLDCWVCKMTQIPMKWTGKQLAKTSTVSIKIVYDQWYYQQQEYWTYITKDCKKVCNVKNRNQGAQNGFTLCDTIPREMGTKVGSRSWQAKVKIPSKSNLVNQYILLVLWDYKRESTWWSKNE